MSRRHLYLLAAAVTDATFERTRLDGRLVWVGKCIHCNSKLVIDDCGLSLGEATLEHIIPQTRGGSNALTNLAVACGRCNREKGKRHDHKRGTRFDDVVATLQARRTARWRQPDEVGMAARFVMLADAALAGDDGEQS